MGTVNFGSFQVQADFETATASCTVNSLHTDNIRQNGTVQQMNHHLNVKCVGCHAIISSQSGTTNQPEFSV